MRLGDSEHLTCRRYDAHEKLIGERTHTDVEQCSERQTEKSAEGWEKNKSSGRGNHVKPYRKTQPDHPSLAQDSVWGGGGKSALVEETRSQG